MNWEGKKVLVTGCCGLIGKELTPLLEEKGAIVCGADLKHGEDLRYYDQCLEITKGMDFVFLLHGIKGNPKMTQEKPLDFFTPMIMANTNMLEACRINKVERVLYTSSIAVNNPQTDKYPAIAKLLGEQQIDAARIQYPEGTQYCVVRPSNVYGCFDNFGDPHAMVITSLIHKAAHNKLEIWGDGSQTRDFINAKDAARGMMQAMEEMPDYPVNLCGGVETSIREAAEIIAKEFNIPVSYVSNQGKVMGDNKRTMEINWNFKPEISIEEGIKEVVSHVRMQGI